MNELPEMKVFPLADGRIGVRLNTSNSSEFWRIVRLNSLGSHDDEFRFDIARHETSLGPNLDLETLVRHFSPSFKLTLIQG